MKVTWLLVVVAVVVLSVAGTVTYSTSVATASPEGSVALAAATNSDLTAEVDISGLAFHPRELHAALGTAVTWTNHDHAKYTVTGADFDSGNLGYHGVFTHTFYEVGRYAYHCEKHPWMKGVIVVE